MRDLAILTFVTLDGVMQGPSKPDEDLSGGFEKGGWAAPFWEEVMIQVGREAMAMPYDMLFGRKTYDLFAEHWTQAEDEPAGMMNAARKYVVSRGKPDLGWANSHLISGDVPANLRALKRSAGPLLQVHGSANLIQTLLAHDLIDEFRLWTFPVVAGCGKRLFDPGAAPNTLRLVKHEQTENGVVMAIYRRT
ncbi:MAG: dihydrofolate reductase family protein [Roseibium sp.]|uniref:dihydrofolate reductase family protein n=1 Tax=Roseibium sp. TaxID=1936156 RepID=UPI002618918A|nr:dihydrofolate reductase family protein [Roseibium sp.]MCV0426330.1 dihydrofolate reductase family protein [Roseibium sp.]